MDQIMAAPGSIEEQRAREIAISSRPSIGRIVHYTNLGDSDGRYPPETQAALITGVYNLAPRGEDEPFEKEPGAPDNRADSTWEKSMFVDLTIFYRTGQFQMQAVPFALEPKRGHWNWPPKV